MKIIVLAAGSFEHNQVFVSDIESPLIIPFGGRPLLHTIIENLKNLPVSEVVFAIPESADRTRKLLEKQKMHNVFKVSIIGVRKADFSGSMDTLRQALGEISDATDQPLLVLHGDGLYVFDELFFSKSLKPCVFVDKSPNYSNRYSSVILDEYLSVVKFCDKSTVIKNDNSSFIETGAYYFPSYLLVRSIFETCERINSPSDIFSLYGSVIEAKFLRVWMDLGHWDLISSQNNLNSPRSFNRIELSKSGQTLRKSSDNISKIEREFDFLTRIPPNLAQYFPRVFVKGDNFYDIEYWPLKTLSEYFVYWGLPISIWKAAANSIVNTIKEFESVEVPRRVLAKFCEKKLIDRIIDFPPELSVLLEKSSIVINNQKYDLGKHYLANFLHSIGEIQEYEIGSFVHGDLCFSNILYSPDSGLVKFVDPRGSMRSKPDVTSIMYDLAKLLHSFSGSYDFIVQDFFDISLIEDGVFSFEIFSTPQAETVATIFTNEIVRVFPNINLDDLHLIEASLFFSMIPLHSDSPSRQLAFLLKGIQIFASLQKS